MSKLPFETTFESDVKLRGVGGDSGAAVLTRRKERHASGCEEGSSGVFCCDKNLSSELSRSVLVNKTRLDLFLVDFLVDLMLF